MVGVMMRIHQVRHLVAHAIGGGDFVDRPLEVAADRRRCVEEDDAFPRCQERGLVRPVGHPVEVPLDATDKIALVVERRTER